MANDLRLPYVDVAEVQYMLAHSESNISRLRHLLRDEPGRLTQTRLASLETFVFRHAMARYALGEPIPLVREELLELLRTRMQILENRVPSEAFSVLDVKLTPTKDGRYLGRITDATATDWSIGNAWDGYQALLLALALGSTEDARAISARIWDPPAATYVGKGRFAVYTVAQQLVAYAARSRLQDDMTSLHAALQSLRRESTEALVDAESRILECLVEGSHAELPQALVGLLRTHARQALMMENRDAPRFFLCFAALGWAAWALKRGVLAMDEVPWSAYYAPRELVVQT